MHGWHQPRAHAINVDNVLEAAFAVLQRGDSAHATSMHLAMVSAEMTHKDMVFLRSLTKNKKMA